MATGIQNQENETVNLKKQLALAVRSIQWSYAIFWSISATQPGVLEWSDGYYNGDIKTRKTIQAIELNSDQMGLQRSEQLRELYESLSDGEAYPQARRPSASLSPEDLSDAEWYYLVCMSFNFNIGEGLPGRTLANAQPIWLCNAHFADSKVFNRSLLAKSASIQTVVCFPFLGGVIELGTTDQVREDPGFVQHVKSSYLEISYPTASMNSPSVGNTRNNKTFACAGLDQDLISAKLIPVKELEVASPDNSSNGLETIQVDDDSFVVEGRNGEAASQVRKWEFVDEELSNCVLDSMESSDCISQTLVNKEKVVSCNKLSHPLQDLQSDDLHYQGVLSTLLKSSHQFVLRPHHRNCHQASNFVNWKKGGFAKSLKPRNGFAQEMLKKVLFEVPKMHIGCMVESPEDNANRDGVWRPEAEGVAMNHALSERKRREKLRERFSILRSLVPSVSKDDKVSILDDAIEYLKELERRVQYLESCWESTKSEPTLLKRKPQDIREGTSDNYGNKKAGDGKKTIINKRKACDIVEKEPDRNYAVSENNAADNYTSVIVKNKEVSIEMRCSWRERVLLEIMDVLSNINLDSHSVESLTKDGILSLTIKSKFRGSAIASATIIKKALEKIV